MKLTPLDIRKQEFKKVMRGYDPDEIDAFNAMIADEFEQLIREKNLLNDELIKIKTQLKDYQQVEHTLRETLLNAQNTVESSRNNSKREGELIIREAELEAENIVRDAKEHVAELNNEVAMLKSQKMSFSKRLRHLLESQIELLQVMEMEDLKPRQVAEAEEEHRRRFSFPEETPVREPEEPSIIMDNAFEDEEYDQAPTNDQIDEALANEAEKNDHEPPVSDQLII